MKLARFDHDGTISAGVVVDGGIVDLSRTNCAFRDIEAIIAGGEEALAAVRAATAGVAPHVPLAHVRLLAPYHPANYLAIGMNYGKHVAEAQRLGVEKPQYQYWFNKQITCIAGPYDDVDPGVSEALDYEVELGVVIGREAKNVKAGDALGYIFGYVVANDFSARDWQRHCPTFTIGKSFDTHGPIGPWIVTADEIPDPQALDLRCLVNGEVRQQSNTANMLFSVAQQIEYLSTAFTLKPGDLLATGTPEGVGVAMQPPVFLQEGDVVRCEVEGIGMIENKVAARK
ncbi:fumarylacetoacetate hydrolase family protein [Novosphingobium album (ex Hu et al. 2023)]|uniref:Fumarylacetoacetate hydrolase family protein n=1 Tax=Novosphingobium album (ex Hu et al. 2023) TaxID=2930093 RepID=A0ABT0B6N7_9SPHN|nr:fumarylacetoacetate hydrolase family protein [Novosphingobium album (ex Hu et al. 2023)]MCJ2180741.1 fumarylacetoacetate hydrolase family protein [Novosphingobium album (ex Hu et al. 2023)]